MFWPRTYPARNKWGCGQRVTVKNLKVMACSSVATCVRGRIQQVLESAQPFTVGVPAPAGTERALNDERVLT